MASKKVIAGLMAATAVVTTLLVTSCGENSSDAQYRRVTNVDIRGEEAAAAAPQNKFGFAEALQPSFIDSLRSAVSADRGERFAPGISPTAAPGVAFTYRYAFVLPDKAISTIQEQHATACEKLGPNQCRITGMRYTMIDKDRVEALLQFKLSPTLARTFGKEGIAAVEKAEGQLVDAAIEGNDVGAKIAASQQRSDNTETAITSLQTRLAQLGKGNDDMRGMLTAQIETMRAQLLREKNQRVEGVQQLADTPMTYIYAGQQGFALGNHPISDAGGAAWGSFVMLVSVILIGLGYLLPWLLLLLLGLAIARTRPVQALRQQWGSASPEPSGDVVEDTPVDATQPAESLHS